jgi:tetratricopeptide (TPR) repeat protein
LARRLDRLSPAARQALAIGAVVGDEFDLAVVQATEPAGDAGSLDAMESGGGRGLIAEVPGAIGRYRFAHALVRHVILAPLSSTKRARLHWQVAIALAAATDEVRSPIQVSQLANHCKEGMAVGDPAMAVEWLERAAQLSAAQFAYEEAIEHYQNALAALDRCPPDQNRRYRLLAGLGTAANALSDFQTAHPAWLEAASVARAIGDAKKLSAAAWQYALLLRIGPLDEDCIGLMDEALELAGPGDSAERATMLALRALHHTGFRPPAQLEEDGSEALAIARRVGQPLTLALVLDSVSSAIRGTSRASEQRQMIVEQLELLTPTGRIEPMIFVKLAVVDLQLGQRDRAEWAIQRAEELARERHWMPALSSALLLGAAVALTEGRFNDAKQLAARARDAGNEANDAVVLGYQGQVAAARIEQGRAIEILDGLKNLVRASPTLQPWRAMLAGLYADLGRIDEARGQLHGLAQNGFAAVPRTATFPLAIRYLAETCCQLHEVSLARRLLEEVEPYGGQMLVVGQGTSVEAAADRSLGQLYWTTGRLDDADRAFSAARQLELKIGARALAARTCYWHAKMLAASGKPEVLPQAATLLHEVIDSTEALGMQLLNRQARQLKEDLHP